MAKLDYRHPEELKMLQTLLHNKLIKALVELYQTMSSEMVEFAEIRNRNFIVTQLTHPRVYKIFQTACRQLDISYSIPVYLEFGYEYNARTVGTNGNCAIIITGKCLEGLSDNQLLALFGRQLAHIYYKHIAYLNIDSMIDTLLQRIPFAGQAVSETAKALLLNWRQCAEITADRGGAIASGSIDDVWDILLLSMGSGIRKYQTEFHRAQHLYDSEYSPGNNMAANLIIRSVLDSMDVPFGNRRIANLDLWGHSEWCRMNFQHIYYSSIYGTEYDSDNTAAEDLRQSVLWREQDAERSIYYLHNAAKKGSGQAMVQLGLFYLRGQIVKQELRCGESYIRRSALNGNADGQYYLSKLYRQGLGNILPENPAMADWLLRLAAGKGQQDAVFEMQNRPVKVRVIEFEQLSRVIGVSDIAADDKLSDWLWIPKQDRICAVDFCEEDSSISDAIAICDSGIYLRRNGMEPQWINWKTFLSGNAKISSGPNTVLLRLNGHEVWHNAIASDNSSIIDKLSKIVKVFKL